MERSLLFWRSFTHWVGGMGVLVFVMAVLPMSDGHGMHILRAEVPGPSVGKLVSKMSHSAKILYAIYLAMTLIEIIFLLFGGMPLFDSLITAFGTAGTGGFSNRALSIGAYNSAYIDIVVGVFMLLFGVNFNLYYFLIIGKVRDVFRSEELRAYLLIVAAAVIMIALNIMRMYSGFAEALRYSFFQVSSIITTTGFATADFNLWPAFSQTVLVVLMFIGACAGSTGGGMKVARIVILTKTSYHDMRRMTHPNAISTVRFEGKPQSERALRSVHLYLTVFVIVFTVSTLLLSLEGYDLVTTFTAVAACINNIGPGLGDVGPMGGFSEFSAWGKLLLSFDMLAGRLEIFPMLLLFVPTMWKRKKYRKVQ
jgi:trk system potassium uptake protein TrkH